MPLEVTLLISKKSDGEDGEDCSKANTALDPRMTKSLANLDFQDADEDTHLYKMDVKSSGKFSRKATWDDLNQFTGQKIDSDVLRDWIVTYQERCFPDGTCLCCG
jgi:endo-1,4-beta-mannosidase